MVANALDSNSGTGNQGTPSPDTSDTQNVQPPSTNAPAQPLDQVRALVSDAVREALQNPDILKGMKDRRFTQIQRTLDDVSPVLDRIKGILTPEQQSQFAQIQRDAEFEELKQVVYGNPKTQTGTNQGGTPASAAFDVEAVITSLQFQANDPALAALKIKHAGNPQTLVQAAADLRLSQLQSPPTPATALSQAGGQINSGTDYDALAAEYDQLSLNPAANFERMTQIRQELDKLK